MDFKIPSGESSSNLTTAIPIKSANEPIIPWSFHAYNGPVEEIECSTPAPSFSNIRDERYKPCDRIAFPSWPKQSVWLTEEMDAPVFLDQAIRKMENGHLQGYKFPKIGGEVVKDELTKPKKLKMVLDLSDDEDGETNEPVEQKPKMWIPVHVDQKKTKCSIVIKKRKAKRAIVVKARVAYRNKSFSRFAGPEI
jgi:hypothetical protein